MRLVAIIQARMGSSRLPGKVLRQLGSKTVLARVLERVAQAGVFRQIVVATTTLPADQVVADCAAAHGALAVRGSESDVLGRYGLAAEASGAQAIARITADCPLIDPDVLGEMARRFIAGQSEARPVDLVSNARRRTFPRGLDAEIFTRDALEQMLRHAHEPHHREHVTPYLYEHPEKFQIIDHLGERDLSHLRWTLDTTEDYELLLRIFASAEGQGPLRLNNVLSVLEAHPDWASLNAHVEQKKVKEG